jgi:uncharacterized membrane protein YqhA
MQRILSGSRYLIIIAVVGAFVAASALLVYGGAKTALLVAGTVAAIRVGSKESEMLTLTAIKTVDVFLLATVLYIIALGLYELFVDDRLPLPGWLKIHELDDLKENLVSVVIVVLVVLFLEQVVAWDGGRDLLGFGAAIALVIAALTYFLSQKPRKARAPRDE